MNDRDEQIRARAYEIWENEGRPEGRSAEHWRMAADEFASVDTAGQPKASRRAPTSRSKKPVADSTPADQVAAAPTGRTAGKDTAKQPRKPTARKAPKT
ncbi:conserved hypothetical protein [Altererythrobacter sp. B11]|uniref:DUF2934 domain-containing protein n=1 Tax=Altererythrobacter sp. B11 TaxID=2060312 RepID=UPI000DC6E9DA|nr:DUF2934 domain-containing protein [Altererythrobacter sp. B11]BBC73437.1 conserved hypothetical protein [Altererythrobacter sp. B11]